MTDYEIIALFFKRDETVIEELEEKVWKFDREID